MTSLTSLKSVQEILDQNNLKNDSLRTRSLKDKSAVFKSYPNPVETYLFVIGTKRLQSVEFINSSGKSQLFLKNYFSLSIFRSEC